MMFETAAVYFVVVFFYGIELFQIVFSSYFSYFSI